MVNTIQFCESLYVRNVLCSSVALTFWRFARRGETDIVSEKEGHKFEGILDSNKKLSTEWTESMVGSREPSNNSLIVTYKNGRPPEMRQFYHIAIVVAPSIIAEGKFRSPRARILPFTHYMRAEFLAGYSNFYDHEFTDTFSIKELCQKTNTFDIPYSFPDNTRQRLNEFLGHISSLSPLLEQCSHFDFDDFTLNLISYVSAFKIKDRSELPDEIQNLYEQRLRHLKRLLLHKLYPDICPIGSYIKNEIREFSEKTIANLLNE